MKKKATIIIVAFASIVLGASALLYGYYNNKSNDNLPNLTSIATMDEAEVNELLIGYRKIQLREVWEEPDETNSNEDVWVINERTALTVSYNNKDKVVVCGLSTDLQDISVSVAETGGGDAFELLGKNAETISQILSADSWVPDATNCASDYVVTYNGRTIYYHSECGTFNERLEQSNQSLHLTKTDREVVNAILEKYITLDSDMAPIETQKLTLDDVVMLSQKGDALTWSDFEQYQGQEIGSGLYIMRYRINELFEVWVGGVPDETPMYIDLRVNNKADDRIDIRTENVPAFIAAHYDDLPREDETIESLNKLDYQSGTCDGLPEYQLIAADGTVYSINFSEKWVWRGNSEQAELPTELISQLKRVCDVMDEEKPLETRPDEAISQTEAQEIALNECKVNYDYIKAEFDTDKNAWNIGFWEDNAQIASQTILIDTAGKVLSIGYAE